MRTTIKRYKQYELAQVQISPKNKKLVDKFLLICGATAGLSKLKNIERVMMKICDTFNKDMDKINSDDYYSFLNLLKKSDLAPPTKNEMKKYFKRFIKEFYPDWSAKFKGLKEIKLEKEVNKEKINSNTLLTEQDIERLIRACDGIREKALISLLYETAARPEEILKLRWRDVKFN